MKRQSKNAIPHQISFQLDEFFRNPMIRELPLTNLNTEQRKAIHRKCDEYGYEIFHETDRVTGILHLKKYDRIPRKPGCDLRHKALRGLISFELKYSKTVFQLAVKRAVIRAQFGISLDLDQNGTPLMQWKSVDFIEDLFQTLGVGEERKVELQEIDKMIYIPEDPPAPGKFVSVFPAFLVGLLEAVLAQNNGLNGYEEVKISAPVLADFAQRYTEEAIEGSTMNDRGFCKITNLTNSYLIKQRKKDKQTVYSLTDKGLRLARVLRKKFVIDASKIEEPSDDEEPIIIDEESQEVDREEKFNEGALYSNDHGADDEVILLIDQQEMGGGDHRLIEIYEKVRSRGLTVRTRHLKVGDYIWVHRRNGKEYVFPVIIERKRADDLARAMMNERFQNQKIKMLYCKRKLAMNRLLYVLEEDPRRFLIQQCQCGRCKDVVGSCRGPTVNDIERAMEETKNQGFTVIKTKDLDQTVEMLVSVTTELKIASTRGECDLLLEDFEFLAPSKVTRELLDEFEELEIEEINKQINFEIDSQESSILTYPKNDGPNLSDLVPKEAKYNENHSWAFSNTSLRSLTSFSDYGGSRFSEEETQAYLTPPKTITSSKPIDLDYESQDVINIETISYQPLTPKQTPKRQEVIVIDSSQETLSKSSAEIEIENSLAWQSQTQELTQEYIPSNIRTMYDQPTPISSPKKIKIQEPEDEKTQSLETDQGTQEYLPLEKIENNDVSSFDTQSYSTQSSYLSQDSQGFTRFKWGSSLSSFRSEVANISIPEPLSPSNL